MSPTLYEQCVTSLTSHRIYICKGLWEGAYGLSSLSKKTRKSNHLQMSLQRQHFRLSYLKTQSFGPAGTWTSSLLLGRPALIQLSKPGGSCWGGRTIEWKTHIREPYVLSYNLVCISFHWSASFTYFMRWYGLCDIKRLFYIRTTNINI